MGPLLSLGLNKPSVHSAGNAFVGDPTEHLLVSIQQGVNLKTFDLKMVRSAFVPVVIPLMGHICSPWWLPWSLAISL
jgi:hypothetical protein